MKFLFLATIFFFCSCSKPQYSDQAGRIDGISGDCSFYFAVENICFTTQWISFPTESDFGQMLLTFTDRNDSSRYIDPQLELEIILWMPSMGHGSSPVSMTRSGLGQFLASDIFFIMPGTWEIRYTLKNGSEIVEQKIQNITI